MISGNQFLGVQPRYALRINDQPNSVTNNRLVHQQTVYRASPAINAPQAKAQDKIIWRSSNATPKKPVTLPFGCSVKGNNNGCAGVVSCPTGTRVSAVKAACNLESGKVSSAHVNAVPWNITWILRPSKKVREGNCQIANINAQRGQVKLDSLIGQRQLSFRCQERDRNGGDCDVKGAVQCQ